MIRCEKAQTLDRISELIRSGQKYPKNGIALRAKDLEIDSPTMDSRTIERHIDNPNPPPDKSWWTTLRSGQTTKATAYYRSYLGKKITAHATMPDRRKLGYPWR